VDYQVLICSVSRRRTGATFAFPDFQSIFGEHKAFDGNVTPELVEKAKGQLSLLTAEGMSGGARLILELRCPEPLRLLNAFADKLQKRRKPVAGAADAPGSSGLLPKLLKYPIKLLAQLLWGGSPPKGGQYHPLTLRDLYPFFRLELMASLRSCLRNEKIDDLYNDALEVRQRVTSKIAEDLGLTLGLFGLKIERVATFEFLCPRYLQLRQRRGDLAVEEMGLPDDRKQAALEGEHRVLETEQFKDQVRHQEDRERFGTQEAHESTRLKWKEEGESKRLFDELRAQDEERSRNREVAQQRFEREQKLEDAALEVQLKEKQMEKARLAMQVQNEWRDAELQRQLLAREASTKQRLEFLKAYATLPPESILTIALADNPQLTEAYVAAMNARSRAEELQLQERFRQELVKVHNQESGMVSQLMVEAVKQLGIVMAKRAEARPPQVFAHKVELPLPPDEVSATGPLPEAAPLDTSLAKLLDQSSSTRGSSTEPGGKE
jgi:hypothetical protein